MTLKQVVKKAVARFESLFRDGPVYTGHGFTTSDESLSESGEEALRLFRERPKVARKPGMAKYTADSEVVFVIVGYYLAGEKTMVRLMDVETEITYQISEGLFTKLFKLI